MREVSRITHPGIYKRIMKFIMLYRECINEFGWEKKLYFDERPAEHHNRTSRNGRDMMQEGENGMQQKEKTVEDLKMNANYHEYSICNSAEHLPEVANEIITEFFDTRGRTFGLNRDECIDYIRNFTFWLFENGLSSSRLGIKEQYYNGSI